MIKSVDELVADEQFLSLDLDKRQQALKNFTNALGGDESEADRVSQGYIRRYRSENGSPIEREVYSSILDSESRFSSGEIDAATHRNELSELADKLTAGRETAQERSARFYKAGLRAEQVAVGEGDSFVQDLFGGVRSAVETIKEDFGGSAPENKDDIQEYYSSERELKGDLSEEEFQKKLQSDLKAGKRAVRQDFDGAATLLPDESVLLKDEFLFKDKETVKKELAKTDIPKGKQLLYLQDQFDGQQQQKAAAYAGILEGTFERAAESVRKNNQGKLPKALEENLRKEGETDLEFVNRHFASRKASAGPVGGTILKGLSKAGASITGIADGVALAAQGLVDPKGAQENAEEAAQTAAANAILTGQVQGNEFISDIIGQLPNIVPAAKGAQLAGRGAQALGASSKVVGRASLTGAGVGAGLSAGAQQFGSSLGDLKEGQTIRNAYFDALKSGGIEAVGSFVGSGGVEAFLTQGFKETLKTGIKASAARLGKAIPEEALEELTVEVAQFMAVEMQRNPEATTGELIAAAEQGAKIGAVLGGGFSVLGEVKSGLAQRTPNETGVSRIDEQAPTQEDSPLPQDPNLVPNNDPTRQLVAREEAAAKEGNSSQATQTTEGETPAQESAEELAERSLNVVEVPVSDISLSDEVPQFKEGANSDGVVQALEGSFDRRGVTPISIWERVDGRKEVVSGRHRLDLARRSGEETIPAQVFREKDGFSAKDAATLDAELNIRDEQGSVKDYANVFKSNEELASQAEERGLLSRAKGRDGLTLAQDASQETFELHQNSRITDQQAVAVAEEAPSDENLQRVGTRALLDGKSIADARNIIRAARLSSGSGSSSQGDLFGSDDSSIQAMEESASKASRYEREIGNQINAVKGASKRPAEAKKLGVNVKDPVALETKLKELEAERQRVKSWYSHPDLVERFTGKKLEAPTHKKGPAFTEEGGDLLSDQTEDFALSQEITQDGDITTAQRDASEQARAEQDDLQGDLLKNESNPAQAGTTTADIARGAQAQPQGPADQLLANVRPEGAQGTTGGQRAFPERGLIEQSRKAATVGREATPEEAAPKSVPRTTEPETELDQEDFAAQDQAFEVVRSLPTEESPVVEEGGTAPVEKEEVKYAYSGLPISPEKAKETKDEFRRRFQDRFLDLEAAQKKSEKEGVAIPDSQDAYRAETLYHGRVGRKLNEVQDQVQDFVNRVNRAGIELADVERIARAQHASERNAQIDRISAEPTGKGSGITDAEADAILADYNSKGVLNVAQPFVDELVAFNQATLRSQLDNGLITPEAYESITSTYKAYVPLRGVIGATEGEATGGQASGLRARKRQLQRALGRDEAGEATDTLAYSILQRNEVVTDIEKNSAALRLLNLAAVEGNELGSVVNPPKVRYFNEQTGQVSNRVDANWLSKPENADVIPVKVKGEDFYVRLNNERIARNWKNMDGVTQGIVMKSMATVSRYLSSVLTQYNPEFILPNFARDIQTAVGNASEYDIPGLRRSIVRDVAAAGKGVLLDERGKSQGFWVEEAAEFARQGGKMEFFGLQDIEKTKKRIERLSKQKGGVNIQKLAGEALKAIGDFNSAVENATRLSVYSNLKRSGIPRREAADIARNITVNFTRKGEWSTSMNAYKIFFNAGIQGSAKLISAGKSKRVQKVMGGIFVAGFLESFLNRMLGEEDEETGLQYYDSSVPDHVKERNMVIMMGGDKQITIPLPYGYNAIFAMGREVSEVMLGRSNVSDSTSRVVMTSINAFNPISGLFGHSDSADTVQTTAVALSPSAVQAFVESAVNVDGLGRPVKQLPYAGTTTPQSESYFSRASKPSIAAAKFINEATGGNSERSGLVDLSPDTLDHIINSYLGGVGRFGTSSGNLVEQIFTQDEVEFNEIPVTRRFFTDGPKWMISQQFYELRNEVNITEDEKEAGLEPKSTMYKHKEALKETEKKIKDLRKKARTGEMSEEKSQEEALRLQSAFIKTANKKK